MLQPEINQNQTQLEHSKLTLNRRRDFNACGAECVLGLLYKTADVRYAD